MTVLYSIHLVSTMLLQTHELFKGVDFTYNTLVCISIQVTVVPMSWHGETRRIGE